MFAPTGEGERGIKVMQNPGFQQRAELVLKSVSLQTLLVERGSECALDSSLLSKQSSSLPMSCGLALASSWRAQWGKKAKWQLWSSLTVVTFSSFQATAPRENFSVTGSRIRHDLWVVSEWVLFMSSQVYREIHQVAILEMVIVKENQPGGGNLKVR